MGRHRLECAGAGFDSSVEALAVSGTTLYAAGFFLNSGSVSTRYVAQWDGTAWSALGTGMNNVVQSLAVIGTTVYAGGQYTTADGTTANRVAQWNGSAWSPLVMGAANGTDNSVFGLGVSGTTLYVGGNFANAGGSTANHMARWDGSTWAPLGTGGASGVSNSSSSASVHCVLINGSTVYVAGSFNSAGGVPANGVAKWDGSTWSALGTGLSSSATALALGANGTDLYVGGYFSTAGGVPANRVAKWDGSAWSALGSGLSGGSGYSIGPSAMTMSNGLLYVAGIFNLAGGITVNNVAKWDGNAWSALGSGVTVGSYTSGVLALAVNGTTVYVGGDFSAAGGNSAIQRVAQWDGTTWSALGSGVSGTVNALVVGGTTLYAGGSFTAAGGAPANYIALWNGSAWSALGSGLSNSVSALLLDGTNLYAGGSFTTAGGSAANRVAMWDGSSWTSLGTGADNGVGNGSVYSLALKGTDLYVGGSFATAGGLVANNVAYYGAAPTPLPVELTAFTATAEGNTAVALAWATASEQNTLAFEVERSQDGKTFAHVSTVAAAGSSSTSRRYELLDTNPLARQSVLYYRLKQLDVDGTYSYSPVRTVALAGASAGLSLYPNPAPGGQVRLVGSAPAPWCRCTMRWAAR
ncbi:hypothetical protein [Hymenobacter sp. BRD67]|uniref:hypothetical protein n=1 Tax=Hymenobacter sp. BRD67 TaxID=2675877 RepID=UPI0015665176|nr:hypothetical protein [Hymenobacter sp. BRD67]QKG53067.1 hypothetical protein GKZ67_11230 [Hymenobacter sp. BRD67]